MLCKLKRCHTCGKIILFSRKMYHGVGRGVGYKDGKDIEFCAMCSYEIFNHALDDPKVLNKLLEKELVN